MSSQLFVFEPEPARLPLKLAECWYWPNFMQADQASAFMDLLVRGIPYRQDKITMFGKQVLQPRLVCWMADPGIAIKYSGLKMEPSPWIPEVLGVKTAIEQTTQAKFNSVLINYYRDGQDSMGWHSDDEKELGHDPIIASLSLGTQRNFQFKNKDGSERFNLLLTNGSLLIMGSGCQKHYKHQLPKSTKLNESRINLTFRLMKD